MDLLTKRTKQISNLIIVLALLVLTGCKQNKKQEKEMGVNNKAGGGFASYGDDVSFLGKYTDIIQLSDPSGRAIVAVSPALQGRVMTSTSSGFEGRSYGWINRGLFESGDTSEHINVFGGEERFWLGPEGGQFSVFFKNGSEFNLKDWHTPGLIDLEPYDVENVESDKVVFRKDASLTNYSGFKFDLSIEREIAVLSNQNITEELGLEFSDEIKVVGYQTTNTLINKGKSDWKKETGLLSIWILGMFNPSPATTVVIPYISGGQADQGIPINVYESFGKIPPERLIVQDEVAYFRGDGQHRSKIGLSPTRAKDVLGSYDSSSKVLTIVKYNKPEGTTDYVNSAWEFQDEPYAGDVVNSYNDGSPEPGKKPLGPFYELETSSPALALKVGQMGIHIQMTFHFEGSEKDLNPIARKLLGTSLEEIKSAFK